MRHAELTEHLLHESYGKTANEVVIVDEEGFVHVPTHAFWDAEENRWTVRTRWPRLREGEHE